MNCKLLKIIKFAALEKKKDHLTYDKTMTALCGEDDDNYMNTNR